MQDYLPEAKERNTISPQEERTRIRDRKPAWMPDNILSPFCFSFQSISFCFPLSVRSFLCSPSYRMENTASLQTSSSFSLHHLCWRDQPGLRQENFTLNSKNCLEDSPVGLVLVRCSPPDQTTVKKVWLPGTWDEVDGWGTGHCSKKG